MSGAPGTERGRSSLFDSLRLRLIPFFAYDFSGGLTIHCALRLQQRSIPAPGGRVGISFHRLPEPSLIGTTLGAACGAIANHVAACAGVTSSR